MNATLPDTIAALYAAEPLVSEVARDRYGDWWIYTAPETYDDALMDRLLDIESELDIHPHYLPQWARRLQTDLTTIWKRGDEEDGPGQSRALSPDEMREHTDWLIGTITPENLRGDAWADDTPESEAKE